MGKKKCLKYFLKIFCVSVAFLFFTSNSFAREGDTAYPGNMNFSIHMVPILQNFNPEQMHISFYGVSSKNKPDYGGGQAAGPIEQKGLGVSGINQANIDQTHIDQVQEQETSKDLYGRLCHIADFLLQYIHMDLPVLSKDGTSTGIFSGKASQDKKKMKFKFEASQSDLSGAVFFIMQI